VRERSDSSKSTSTPTKFTARKVSPIVEKYADTAELQALALKAIEEANDSAVALYDSISGTRCTGKKMTPRLSRPSRLLIKEAVPNVPAVQIVPGVLPLRSCGKKETKMRIRIDGGVVVGWSGTSHELVVNGSVLIDGDTITSVGHGQITTCR